MNTPRVRLLSAQRLFSLARDLRVELVMTTGLITIEASDVRRNAQALLDQYSFDQVPILDGHGLVGVLDRSHLAAGQVDEAIHDGSFAVISEANTIEQSSSLLSLLRKLVDNGYCLVLDDDNQLVGLVHVSDLNRQVIRAYFYLLISATEIGLAAIISTAFRGDDWQQLVSPKRLEAAVGRHRREMQAGVELTLLETVDFDILLEVVRSSPQIAFPIETGSLGGDQVAQLRDLRNAVMHSVKPMISGQRDAGQLLKSARLLRRIYSEIWRQLSVGN